jgi:hypothetical protein
MMILALALAMAAQSDTPDYRNTANWLCRPGRQDACTLDLSTTVVAPDGKRRLEPFKAASDPKFDCFYVYPTVSEQPTPQATLAIDPAQRSIALYQAARYSRVCRVFAPMYRQYTLQALNQPTPGVAQHGFVGTAAYADVVQAWRTYLRKYNHGRGVVLIGHSQGTLVLRKVIAKEIDPKPSVRRKLVSAVLLGGNVLVRKGSGVGGDFRHIPACRSDHQLGCVIAFSTFDGPVPANAIFGRTAAKGMAVLCTNPAALAGGSGLLDPVYPTTPFAPSSTLAAGIALVGVPVPHTSAPWVEAPGSYRAHCSSGGAHVLEVTPRAGAPTPKPIPDATWGLHLTDANIALGNLTTIVSAQALAYATG